MSVFDIFGGTACASPVSVSWETQGSGKTRRSPFESVSERTAVAELGGICSQWPDEEDTIMTKEMAGDLPVKERARVIQRLIEERGRDQLMFLDKFASCLSYAQINIPKVFVRFENLTVTTEALVGDDGTPTVPRFYQEAVGSVISCCGVCKNPMQLDKAPLDILKNVTGFIPPSSPLLVLGPPSAGKSVLLKTLCGKIKHQPPKYIITGGVEYNGKKLGSEDFSVEQTAAFIDQEDVHIATLSVRETFEFSRRCHGLGRLHGLMRDILREPTKYGIDPATDADWNDFYDFLNGMTRGMRTELLINILLLSRAADTVVGDAMLRGVSGGEKRRVTTGEMLVGNKLVLFMDEISTGLDSSSTYLICKAITNAAKVLGFTSAISLLQPQPETFELFQDLLVLAEGQIIYQGPRNEAILHFESIGFRLPAIKDEADFIQEIATAEGQLELSPQETVQTVDELAEKYNAGKYGQHTKQVLGKALDPIEFDGSILSTKKYSMSPLTGFQVVFEREWKIYIRDYVFLIGRTIQVILMAVIIGTLFLKLDIETEYLFFISVQFFSLMFLSFSAMPQLALTLRNRKCFYKHRDAHFFSAFPWGMSLSVINVPQIFVEGIIYTSIVYWLVGFAPQAGKFFTFILILATNAMCMGGIFRALAAFSPSLEFANALSIILLFFVVIMSGFTILRGSIPDYAIWLYWISPYSYSMRALAINEFTARRWENPCVTELPTPALCESPSQTFGDFILESFDFQNESWWIWVGIGYNIGIYVLTSGMAVMGFSLYSGIQKTAHVRGKEIKGRYSRRAAAVVQSFEMSSPAPREESSVVDHDNNSNLRKFDVPPVELAFLNLRYFVPKPGSNSGEELELLKGITAYTRPGTLTALMGSSGAGKTTLMDVIAGRKTVGRIEGEITLNGYPKNQLTLRRIMGYVEQFDVSSSALTVFETICFSARLRLPRSTTRDEILSFCWEQARMLQLHTIADQLVGLPGVDGISVEQRKRLSIGVELAANPGIVFMDEPTSGLDARAAAIVMKSVRHIGSKGRSIVCTIHQPSREIFGVFDNLLLLKRGGETIFFGPIGKNNAESLTSYLESVSGLTYSASKNPANWMLEVAEQSKGIDFAQKYNESSLSRAAAEMVATLQKPREGTEPVVFESTYAASYATQFYWLAVKYTFVYWRLPMYNGIRLFITVLLGLLFGAIYWDLGTVPSAGATQADVQNIMGALYASVLFLGASNLLSVLPVVGLERIVFYRERATGMYATPSYQFGLLIAEVPYLLVQTTLYICIIYFMIGFDADAGKFFTFYLILFGTLSLMTFFGQMAAFCTPNQQTATMLAAFALSFWNLFMGFIIPRPQMPWYWKWINYINPLAYSLNALVTSQLGDNNSFIFFDGVSETISDFLDDYLGFTTSFLWPAIAILFSFVLFFRFLGFVAMQFLNFQKK